MTKQHTGKQNTANHFTKIDTLTLVLIGIVTIIILVLFVYKLYIRVENFSVPNNVINDVSYLDTSIPGNKALLDNNYMAVMSDAYNKLTLQDENAIQNLYTDAIARTNVITNLGIANKTNVSNKSSIFPGGSLIKTIKSKNNAQMLSLTSNDVAGKYGVNINDQCLTVSGTCANNNKYCTQDCQNSLYSSDSQKFTVKNIATIADAKKIMGSTSSINSASINSASINSANVYPFNIVMSGVDNTCLAMSNSGVTLEECNLNDIRHQWSISPDDNICLGV